MNRIIEGPWRLGYLLKNVFCAVKVIGDSRLAGWQNTMFALLAAGCCIWPDALIANVAFVGQLDDLGVLLLLLAIFISQMPEVIIREHGWRNLY